MPVENVIIIGNGVSGITLARHIRKSSDHNITVISNESKYFFSRTALMYVYMGDMTFENTKPYEDWFWDKNRIDLVEGTVVAIDTGKRTITLDNNKTLTYDKLVIATGAKPRSFDWLTMNIDGVQGFYHKQDLESLETYTPNSSVCKRAVVIGGGLIGIELVEMLASRGIPVTFVVRKPFFKSGVLTDVGSEMISKHIKEWGIDLRVNSTLQEIRKDENNKVRSIIIKETQEEITCDFVGITIGVAPNIGLVNSSDIETRNGILVNEFLETNVPDVYAIGNCAEPRDTNERSKFEANWHTARMMGETLAQTLCGNRIRYNPGHPFDAAMFLGIEFQSYGTVNSTPKPGTQHLHWKHVDNTKCITFEYDLDSQQFLGINTFGIRMRHEVFDRWLTEKRSLDYVIKNLRDANFDPEFSESYENDVLAMYNARAERFRK